MNFKQLFFMAFFSAYSLSAYDTLREKKSKTPERWTLDTQKLESDIQRMFYTQAVLGYPLDFDANDWNSLAQGNPFFLEKIHTMNYECLCYAQNEPKYLDFCKTYKINGKSYDEMRNGLHSK